MKYICEIIKKWKEESGCGGVVQFKYSHSTGILIIYSAYPGYLIGKSGFFVDKYSKIFKNEVSEFTKVEFVETDYHYA